jgi:hypothetical protein
MLSFSFDSCWMHCVNKIMIVCSCCLHSSLPWQSNHSWASRPTWWSNLNVWQGILKKTMSLGGVDFKGEISHQEFQIDWFLVTIVVTISLALEFVQSLAWWWVSQETETKNSQRWNHIDTYLMSRISLKALIWSQMGSLRAMTQAGLMRKSSKQQILEFFSSDTNYSDTSCQSHWNS